MLENGIVIALLAGFVLDILFGDPRWLYHPVRIIGNSIAILEKVLRRMFPATVRGERAAGMVLLLLICLGSCGIPFLILFFVFRWNVLAGILVESFMCYQMLATKSLEQESMKVYRELEKGDLEGSRHAVSMIVGRDTQNLTEEGVTKATVETIAENTSDGVTAPLFYMAIGGAPLMFLYKGINTMDSMVGYKSDKYINFGRYPAKLDDITNYIPARLSAWLMIASCPFLKLDGKKAREIYFRDRYQHASPNSAQTESVIAGALGVQLAGDAWYFGKCYSKPTIGDSLRPVVRDDIKRAIQLMYLSSFLGTVLFAICRLLIGLLL
ncbi:MAG: adenosylcobinamide-phosphate synthase CbiB [Lachnospiraceae bacterium]|jgi:adenosylcobinamide-phosphate synthase